MTTTFFIPIKSMNLAHYLSSGIIAPTNFIENRNQDLQNRFINNLLLSTNIFTVDTNCSLEIALNEKEEFPEKISDNFFLFNKPLPISRIKAIHFSDKDQKTNTVFNITSGAAFIPHNILKISDNKPISTSEIDFIANKPTEVDWKHYLKKYDQLLGGFALLKIGKEDFQNYPTHYFKSLGNINKYFNKILEEQNIEIENVFEFAFTDDGKFKSFHDTIYSDITSEVVSRYATKENIKIETRNGLLRIDKIPESTQTYFVSILENYGSGKRKQVDSFISDLVSGKFNKKRKEALSLIFGINKGYSSFRNKYKTENFETKIKFQLDSKLDYYIIESIYQNVFNNQDFSSTYTFIDNWCSVSIEQDINNSTTNTYRVLDKTIIFKKKEDIFLELFPNFLEERNKLFEIVSKNLSKVLPKFLTLNADLFKEQLGDEYEQFFRNYSQFIFMETQKRVTSEYEIENNSLRSKIINFERLIETQQNEIKQLRDELKNLQISGATKFTNVAKFKGKPVEDLNEDVQEDVRYNKPTEESKSLHKTNDVEAVSENKKESEYREEIRKENLISELKDESNKAFSGSLFSDGDTELKKKIREKDLRALKIPALKSIAAALKIMIPSSAKKADIIIEILRREF